MKQVFTGIIIIGIVIYALSKCNQDEPTPGQPETFNIEKEKTSAYIEAEFFIKSKLKSPSTADFPQPNYESDIRYTDDSTFVIRSYVDSQNGFGAKLRSQWMVQLKRKSYNTESKYDILNYKVY